VTCRLVVIIPATETTKRRFRNWRSERTNGAMVTISLGFETETAAMKYAHPLPWVWAVENAEDRA
jgi:hypothetical protein